MNKTKKKAIENEPKKEAREQVETQKEAPAKLSKKLRKFSFETRIRSSKDFSTKLVKMFKDYIKSVIIWGSISRGDYTGKSDVDIYVIFDDTKMPLKKFDEIREKIDNDISKLAEETDPRLHLQPVIALTEFWDGIRKTHPLFYNIVREGYAVHDTGFFIPMRKLLEWGKFPATKEAAEARMDGVPKRVERVQSVKLYMIAEDLYYAFTDAAQALLMFIGVGPPAPKVLAREVRKHLVEPGILEEKYAQMIEDVIKFRKAVEHKEIKEIKGEEVDAWIEKTKDYVQRMEKLLHDLEFSRKASDIKNTYEIMIKATVAALKSMKKLPEDPKELPNAFKKYLIDAGMVNPMYSEVFEHVIKARKMLEDKKLDKIPDREIELNKEYVRRFIVSLKDIIKKDIPEEPKEEKK